MSQTHCWTVPCQNSRGRSGRASFVIVMSPCVSFYILSFLLMCLPHTHPFPPVSYASLITFPIYTCCITFAFLLSPCLSLSLFFIWFCSLFSSACYFVFYSPTYLYCFHVSSSFKKKNVINPAFVILALHLGLIFISTCF